MMRTVDLMKVSGAALPTLRRMRSKRQIQRVDVPPAFREAKSAERRSELSYCFYLVGAGRFELPTPSPPDWCANQAALRSEPLISMCYATTSLLVRGRYTGEG